jgi:hypothetical protein
MISLLLWFIVASGQNGHCRGWSAARWGMHRLLLELQYLVVPGTGTTTVACTGKYLGLRRLKTSSTGSDQNQQKAEFAPILADKATNIGVSFYRPRRL